MGPRERRLIRRTMILATVLVALMLAATLWTVLRSGPRGMTAGSQDTNSSSDSASPDSSAQ